MFGLVGLGSTGLAAIGSAGLKWAGFGWNGLGWGWNVLGWVRLRWFGPGWDELNLSLLDSTRLNLAGKSFTVLGCAELSPAWLDWVRFGSAVTDSSEFDQACLECGATGSAGRSSAGLG